MFCKSRRKYVKTQSQLIKKAPASLARLLLACLLTEKQSYDRSYVGSVNI